MEDLNLTVRLLEASSKLKSASLALESISKKTPPGPEAAKTLKWVGEFLMLMDWSSRPASHSNITPPELEPQVTSVRPTFYSSLLHLGPALEKEEISNQEELFKFLRTLYIFLEAPIDEGSRFKPINEGYSRLGAKLLQELSQAIMIQLNSSNLPSGPQLLTAGHRTRTYSECMSS